MTYKCKPTTCLYFSTILNALLLSELIWISLVMSLLYIHCTRRFRKESNAVIKSVIENRSYSVTNTLPRLSIFAESIDLAGWGVDPIDEDFKRLLSEILRDRATSIFHEFHSLDVRRTICISVSLSRSTYPEVTNYPLRALRNDLGGTIRFTDRTATLSSCSIAVRHRLVN